MMLVFTNEYGKLFIKHDVSRDTESEIRVDKVGCAGEIGSPT